MEFDQWVGKYINDESLPFGKEEVKQYLEITDKGKINAVTEFRSNTTSETRPFCKPLIGEGGIKSIWFIDK